MRKSNAGADATSCEHERPTSVLAPRAEPLEVAAPAGEPLHVAEARAGDDAVGAERARPKDAVRDPASIRVGKGRRRSLASTKRAVLSFGCAALLASFGVVVPSDAPPPRAGIVVQHPQAAAPAAAPAPTPPSTGIGDFLARGDERLKSGDVFAARLFYEKAADAGNAHGALMVGATFDPTFLASVGVYGLGGDEKAALAWYRRASDLGDPEAAKLETNLRNK